MCKKFVIYFTFLLLMISPVSAQNFGADELINISVYERINPAIVAIEANLADGFSAGTGCVIRSDGVILTGSHVIDEAMLQLLMAKFTKHRFLLKWEKTTIWHYLKFRQNLA